MLCYMSKATENKEKCVYISCIIKKMKEGIKSLLITESLVFCVIVYIQFPGQSSKCWKK